MDKLKLKKLLYGTEQDYERESTPSEEFHPMRKVDRSRILRRPTPDIDEEGEFIYINKINSLIQQIVNN